MEYFKQLRSFVGHSPLILPGSLVIVLNEKRQILLQNRTDGTWGLPGGLMEIEESLEDAARREVFEETGLKIGTLELVNVFSGPDYFQKISNGDESYFISALYMTDDISGEIIIEESESKELKFFNINNIPKPMNQIYRDCINAYIVKYSIPQ